MTQYISSFDLDGKSLPVKYIETLQIKDGVSCDVYSFVGDKTKDLAIVTVEKDTSTPLQLVLQGEQTMEGHVSGSGTLRTWSKNGVVQSYKSPKSQEVKVGEKMQWTADKNETLVFYEICTPPYQDGRFKNLVDPAANNGKN